MRVCLEGQPKIETEAAANGGSELRAALQMSGITCRRFSVARWQIPELPGLGSFVFAAGTAKQQLAFIRELLDADGICQTFVKFGTYQTFGSISDFPAPGNELSFVCISTARHRKVKFAINLRSTYAHVCRWSAGVWLRPNCPSMVQFSVTGPTKEQWFEIRLQWLKNWGISYK